MDFLGIVGLAALIVGILIVVNVIAAVTWLGWALAIIGGLILLGFFGHRNHYWR